MSERPTNFLSGSPLNRLSWLRTSPVFINGLVHSPTARWIAFNGGSPLVASRSVSDAGLVHLSFADVKSLIGGSPYFGQGQDDGVAGDVTVSALEAARFRGAPLVFLGLQETGPNDFAPGVDPEKAALDIKGNPYFSIDVTDAEQPVVDALVEVGKKSSSNAQVAFMEPRAAIRGFTAEEAGIFAIARSMIDWNYRNKFCSACGSPQHSLWAGWKLACSSLLPWADNTGRKPCPTATGLHNIAHPRTDAVVIMAVINEANDRILLGRNKKFPGTMYSTLAGFIEPGESFEDAVKREILEEAGIHVWNVRYHSTQPWPYPANLMTGFVATGDPAEPVRTDLDNELEDARWFTRDQVLEVLAHPDGTNLTRRDHRKFAAVYDARPPPEETAGETRDPERITEDLPPFRVPPLSAIAGVLIADWAHGRFPPQAKGNL
ncbi:NUDIX hydrolase domain-like protein [Amylostereum chailletii]|nr:NUDIX hydrolase domain-like protein [Amylostereum chailletii]